MAMQWNGDTTAIVVGDLAEPDLLVERRHRAMPAVVGRSVCIASRDDLADRQFEDAGGAGVLQRGDQRVDGAFLSTTVSIA